MTPLEIFACVAAVACLLIYSYYGCLFYIYFRGLPFSTPRQTVRERLDELDQFVAEQKVHEFYQAEAWARSAKRTARAFGYK